MKRLLLLVIPVSMLLASCCGGSQEFTWKRVKMDSSRTGVHPSTAVDVPQSIGVIDSVAYTSPNGNVYKNGTATYGAAKVLLGAQPRMAHLKTVIGYSENGMLRSGLETELGDWYIDEMMRFTEAKAGKKVHFGIVNRGGIRLDMPKGDVLMDDIMSMFPFKNNVCYLELYGRDIRALLEQLAATRWQVVGGARCVVKDGKLESAEIDGAPIDDNRLYGVCSISFLLNGGDDISVAKNAKRLDIFPEYIIDVILPYVQRLTAEGKTIDYQKDGRIQIIGGTE